MGTVWRAGGMRAVTRFTAMAMTVGLLVVGGVQAASALGPAVLLSVTVSPTTASVGVGQTEQFSATGHYSDLSTKDLTDAVTWSASSGATISNASGSQGLATATGTGVSTITATDPNLAVPGTAALTVTPAVLLAVTVSPTVASIGVGQTEQFSATGHYSDLSTADLTDAVTWSASSGATISNASGSQGLATATGTGVSTITATDPNLAVPGTAALTVTPAVLLAVTVSPTVASIGVGQTEQFSATGHYSDLSTADLTDAVTWSASSGATISNASGSHGLATATGTGVSTITATDPNLAVPGTAALTVTPAVLLAVTVSPTVASIGVGQTEQFSATGHYSDLSTADLTDAVTWSASSGATISNASGSHGLATATGTGVSTITATDADVTLPGTALLTVTSPVLLAITVSPTAATVGVGRAEQFTATGHYSDLSTADLTDAVTWSASSGATISNAPGAEGLATATATGVSTITATDADVALPGTALLVVTPASGPPPAPSLLTDPGAGKRKVDVVLAGENFTPGETVTVTYVSGLRRPKKATTVLCSAVADSNGSFTCTGMIPKRGRSGKKGMHTIEATAPSGDHATTQYTIEKPPRTKK